MNEISEEIYEEIKNEIKSLRRRLNFLEQVSDGSVYIEKNKGCYITIKPEQMDIEELISDSALHITTKLFDYNEEDDCSVRESNLSNVLKERQCIFLPVYGYRHGCTRLSTKPFGCQWDSGLTGYIYMTREGFEEVGYENEEQCLNYMRKVIDIIDKNQNDELYTTVVYGSEGKDIIDWGFDVNNTEEIDRQIKEARRFIDSEY